MAEEKEPEVFTAADLKRKVKSDSDKKGSGETEETETDKTTEGADEADKASEEKSETGEKANAEGDEVETSEDTDETADEGESDKKDKKKKPFKDKKKKDPRDAQIEELKDKVLRNLAEFENFRNRSEKEKEARFDMGVSSTVEKILPVVDNLERGLAGLSDEERETPFAKGIEAVYKQLQTVFEEIGVKPIEAVGQEFDPNLHQAVMHEEDDSESSNLVIEELQKGYTYKDSVVRYSMVKVLN